MDGNERITLRLERENLERIDSFLKENKEFGNRSNLCRVAVQSFLEQTRKTGDEITLKVPKVYIEYIDQLVNEGYFLSREHAILRCVEEYFSRERLLEIAEHKKEIGKATGKIFPVQISGKDEVISP